jgi:hypothetical protein
MSFNLIRDLPRHGFRGLETLETVDLSYNDLREVDESAFEDMKWLYLLKVLFPCYFNKYNANVSPHL